VDVFSKKLEIKKQELHQNAWISAAPGRGLLPDLAIFET
jgi:hypothetical protein